MIDLAKKYYYALYQKDFTVVLSLAAEDFVFSDPTVLKESGLPVKITSLSEFISYMDNSISDSMKFNIHIVDSFESNKNVVLYIETDIHMPANLTDSKSSKTLDVSTLIQIILTILLLTNSLN